MRRKKHNRITKVLKKPVYAPFEQNDPDQLALWQEDSLCKQDSNKKDIKSMDLDSLEMLKDELVEALFDWDTIIGIELSSTVVSPDGGSLSSYRKRRQKTLVELRAIKAEIEMRKRYNTKELIAS